MQIRNRSNHHLTEYQEFFQANELAWNLKTPLHIQSEFYNVAGFKKGINTLKSIELSEIENISEKDILHLQCHFGLDSLSMARMGANVTGVDFSSVSIDYARQLSEELNIKANFIKENIYYLQNILNSHFDIVFVSYGSITWLPNLSEWARIISSFLKKGSMFFIVDFHPLLISHNFLESDSIILPYFNTKTLRNDFKGTYTDRNASIETREYTWNHSISEIIEALLRHGLKIESLKEYSYLPFNCFSNLVLGQDENWRLKGHEDLYPLCFSLKAIKN